MPQIYLLQQTGAIMNEWVWLGETGAGIARQAARNSDGKKSTQARDAATGVVD